MKIPGGKSKSGAGGWGSFPGADDLAFVLVVRGPDGDGGADGDVGAAGGETELAATGEVDGPGEPFLAAAGEVPGGGHQASGVGEFRGDLQEDDPAGVGVGGLLIGGGHQIEKTAVYFEGADIGGPGAVFGIPGHDGGADGLGDGGHLGFFGGLEGATDDGHGNAGQDADDGDDDQELDQRKSGRFFAKMGDRRWEMGAENF